ncbi:LppX_LprAFG lipoprotein [Prauserella halophila]|uniref:LppX_LprAFG lipoprotein n=1 Tax=Prauserella halophila TaxID=185641 RepID=A0ABN1WGE6_9PSEU|nr:LppX_LprAFG lipoprotein [Prauserella halophila]MCP2238442.1 lipoprotein LprG [Prauserella halophila]
MSRRILVVTASLVALVAGCTSSPEAPESEPPGASLVRDASIALRDVTSVRFDLHTQGALPGFPIRSLDGVATRSGWAAGEVDLQLPAERVQYEYELGHRDGGSSSGGSPTSAVPDGSSAEAAHDNTVTLTDSDDVTTTAVLPERFTAKSLLARDGGLRDLLGDATELSTESREDIEDVPTYRVSGTLPQADISELLPGVTDDVAVKFWVTDNPERTLLRVWLQVPPRRPNQGATMIELGLSEHNQPIDVSSTPPSPSS